jgi:hypothetical protein
MKDLTLLLTCDLFYISESIQGDKGRYSKIKELDKTSEGIMKTWLANASKRVQRGRGGMEEEDA